MTATLPVGGASGPPPEAATERSLAEAAQQFEAVLVRQLLKVLRRTAPSGGLLGDSGPGGGVYLQMFDDALADQLTKAGGLGLSPMVARALGGEAPAAVRGTTHRVSMAPEAPSSSEPIHGIVRRLREVAARLTYGDRAGRWGREGALGPEDLSSAISTQEPGGVARFNVRDANGYRGYYKCNLFAFEVARRAGLAVPVVGRPRGWGYPGPNRVASDATDGLLEKGWASVVTGEDARSLDRDLRRGTRALMLVGSARDGRAGHMALLERVHRIDYGSDGTVRRIVFDGWEARERGAGHLARRTWNAWGNPGGHMARNGFEAIEIVELRRAAPGSQAEVPLSTRAGPSRLDARRSSSALDDPMLRTEE